MTLSSHVPVKWDFSNTDHCLVAYRVKSFFIHLEHLYSLREEKRKATASGWHAGSFAISCVVFPMFY